MSRRHSSGSVLKVQFIDIKRAYFHAKAVRDVFVDLPEQDAEEGMCGKLVYAMYGTRDAAQNWEREYESAFLDLGFTQGLSSPCVFYHAERDIRTVVHGDDFTSISDDVQLKWLAAELSKRYELKLRATLGPEPQDDTSVRILNRIVSWEEAGITYEPDQRHAELIVRELGLSAANKVTTPGVKESARSAQALDKPLSSAEGSRFRSMTMRAAYLAQDRPDIQYAVKELARCMSAPTELDWQSLKRLGRYLVYRPRMVLIYKPQFGRTFMDARVDTDHAGCLKTRRSTNGGALMHGLHTIKSWSSTQSVIALSSGEAEYYGVVKGASVLLGALSLCKDLGIEMKGRVHTDSSAAKGMASRRGLGKTRHIDTQYLWVQERLSSGSFTLHKEGTNDNVGDLFTKHLEQAKSSDFTARLGYVAREGKASLTLSAA